MNITSFECRIQLCCTGIRNIRIILGDWVQFSIKTFKWNKLKKKKISCFSFPLSPLFPFKGREPQPGEFWDVVVVTAVDESQRRAYELQVKEKIERKEVPLGIHYKVFSDPPGCKIGVMFSIDHNYLLIFILIVNNECNVSANGLFFSLGNGGSTLYALQQLSEIYGKALGGMRVILIHAGLSFDNCFFSM